MIYAVDASHAVCPFVCLRCVAIVVVLVFAVVDVVVAVVNDDGAAPREASFVATPFVESSPCAVTSRLLVRACACCSGLFSGGSPTVSTTSKS